MTYREFKLKCYQVGIAYRILGHDHSQILNQSLAFRFLAESIDQDEFEEQVPNSLLKQLENAQNYLNGCIQAMDLNRMEDCEMMFAISAVFAQEKAPFNFVSLVKMLSEDKYSCVE